MSIYEQLALIYVEKKSKNTNSPEELLSMYREALEKIAQCDKDHNGKPFSLE